jgi:purine catabolism regulatory family protein/PucR-like helix-turn-helix protein/diguanylate cyclase with GGDEF domain
VRLHDLLDMPLGLELRTGSAALDRPIRWVYTTELVQPGRYLTGNELVLTGLMWHKGHDDPDGFVATLVDAGVSALGVGTAVHGSVPPELVDACRRQGLPLLEVPTDVSFGTVSELVTRRLMAERSAGLATVLGRHRRLISTVAEGAGLDTVFAVTRDDLGRGCWVVSPTGRIVVGPPAGLTRDQARRLAAEFLTAERLPHVVPSGPGSAAAARADAGTGGGSESEAGSGSGSGSGSGTGSGTGSGAGAGYTLLPINTRAGHRIAGWFLACAGSLVDCDEEIRESAYELAALAALERARVEEGRRVERRLAAELVELVDPGEVAARMRTCGLSPVTPYVAVSAAVSDVAHPDEVGCAVLDELLGGAGGVIWTQGDEAIALVPATVPATALPAARAAGSATGPSGSLTGMRAAAHRLESALTCERLTVGISGPAEGPAALRGAVNEARHTRRLAGLRPGRVHVVTSDELHSYVLLLATVPEGVRRSFRDRLLRPLHAYDAEHHSDLVHTLETFLECSGAWNRCANRLHVHVNTLRYRIRRIEELTGRDLSSLEDRVDFFLALRIT